MKQHCIQAMASQEIPYPILVFEIQVSLIHINYNLFIGFDI